MPSLLVGAQSGGVALISGNPFSGRPAQPTGIYLCSDSSSSGAVYVGASGGLTITSGGALSSGGLLDGCPINPGSSRSIGLGPLGAAGVFVTVPAAVSGRVRLFWEPLPSF